MLLNRVSVMLIWDNRSYLTTLEVVRTVMEDKRFPDINMEHEQDTQLDNRLMTNSGALTQLSPNSTTEITHQKSKLIRKTRSLIDMCLGTQSSDAIS